MTPLAARKRLLLIESEILRVNLQEDAGLLVGSARLLVHDYGQKACKVGSLVGTAAAVWAGVNALRSRTGRRPPGSKPSVLGRLFSGARLVATLWMALRPRASDRGFR